MNAQIHSLRLRCDHLPFWRTVTVAYYRFFPITAGATRSLSKPHKISHAYKTRAREKENPEIKQHENLPNKISYDSRVSQKSNFVANFLDQFRFRKCE